MALAYTAPTWTDGSGEGVSASNLQAISNCIEGLVQGSDKAVHSISMSNNTITLTFADGTQETVTATGLKGISSISKVSTAGVVDTYQILYTDGTTDTFNITNGEPLTLESDTYTDAGGTRTFTFTNSAISTSSRFDFYANVFGVAPSNIVPSNGYVDVQFDTADNVTVCVIEVK